MKTLRFELSNNHLYLIYEPESAEWLQHKLDEDDEITIKKTFSFFKTDKVSDDFDNEFKFVLGIRELSSNKFRIAARHFGISNDVLLDENFKFTPKSFIAVRDISIFRKLGNITTEEIVVADDEGAIPLKEFEYLLSNFPTSGELYRYADARLSRVIQDYLPLKVDYVAKLERALDKRKTIQPQSHLKSLANFETQKYEILISTLQNMLGNSDSYKERDWQKLIVELVLYIFPKYIHVLEEVPVKDFYTNPSNPSTRSIDLGLVDANGHLDIIEIKRPTQNSLLSNRKYRDSFVPKKELSGTVLQVEKYLFHLSKGGRDAEERISKKYEKKLSSFNVKITSPKALVIIGRDDEMSKAELFDFEIIKRKYANVIDILTYDDLLRRLVNLKDKYSGEL